jgi:acetolactate synthase-1/2/3 large subunit
MGTMGFGLPAAIGAQISRPHDTVIAVSGDGSIMMNVQELATIKRYQVPVKIVLIDNAKLGMVRQWQDLFFEGRLSETDLSDNPDFVMLSQAFDIKSRSISKKEQVQSAIEEMLDHDGAYLLRVQIDAADNVWPLVPPNTANDKMMENV